MPPSNSRHSPPGGSPAPARPSARSSPEAHAGSRAPKPCPRPPAAPTHRAAVRGHVEDEEGAARRVRGVGPFPHLMLLHQQAVVRALPLRKLHRQSCEGRTALRRPGPVPALPPTRISRRPRSRCLALPPTRVPRRSRSRCPALPPTRVPRRPRSRCPALPLTRVPRRHRSRCPALLLTRVSRRHHSRRTPRGGRHLVCARRRRGRREL